MSNRVGDRLLIGILVLTAFFAVSVTASGQSVDASTYALQSV